MIIKVLTWFLIICVAKSYSSCEKSNKTLPIYHPYNGTIGENARLIITKGNCSVRNEADKILTSNDGINTELIKLSLCHGIFRDNFDTFLGVVLKQQLQSLVILLTFHNDAGKNEVCLEVNFNNKSFQQTEEILTLVFNHIETVQMKIKGVEGNKVYQQNLSIWRREIPDSKAEEWRRFVYVDTTSAKGMHTIHIAGVNQDVPKIYELLRKNNNDNTETIWDTYDTGEIIHIVPSSDENEYIIQERDRTYHKEITASAIVIFLLILSVLLAALWYASRPKQRDLVVIYCQCDRHSVYAEAVRKLMHLLEQNCMFKLEAPSAIFSRSSSSGENEVLINGNSKTVEFIIFIPFPNVADHDRSYEREVHQLCEKYSKSGSKIELNMHFENNDFGDIRSEWPNASYKSFQLLEDLPNFIRYVHPFYFPSFLERFLRPQLWAPRVKGILDRNTFTNDHLREITDPKFHAQIKTVPNPLQADPNLAINAFI